MKFIRGDSDNLEGMCSIYLEIKDEENKTEYPAIYVGTNPMDLIIPGEPLDILEEIKEGFNELKSKIDENKMPGFEGLVPMVARPLVVDNPDELKDFKGDIFYGGNVIGQELVLPLMTNYALAYMVNYGSQIFGKEEKTEEEEYVEDFRQYDSSGLVKRLSELTGKMMYSFGIDKSEESYVRKRMLAVARGSPFSRQIRNVVRMFYEEGSKKYELIDLNIRLAGAIYGEDYAEADRLSKKIDESE